MKLVEEDLKNKKLELEALKEMLIKIKEQSLKRLSMRDTDQDSRRKYPPSMDYSQRARKEGVKREALLSSYKSSNKIKENYGDDNLLGKLQRNINDS